MAEYHEGSRGEYADRPLAIPRKGWTQVLLRVKEQIAADNLSIVAAGVAFYALLALFPALAALVMIYGLVSDPAEVTAQLEPLRSLMPEGAFGILETQLTAMAARENTGVGIGLLFSLALAVWSSAKGIKALFMALNIAYGEREKRGFVRVTVTALVFTAGAVLFVVASIGLIAGLPAALALIDLGGVFEQATLLLRWPVIAGLAIVALAVVYRWGPSRAPAKFRWITVGAVMATALWLAGSVAFSAYVENFGSYNETYGSLGAVVILLLWFFVSAYCVCLGAELNAELEHQTRRDSTTGPPRPAGSRNAFVADHWPESITSREKPKNTLEEKSHV
jgi:membrane protein